MSTVTARTPSRQLIERSERVAVDTPPSVTPRPDQRVRVSDGASPLIWCHNRLDYTPQPERWWGLVGTVLGTVAAGLVGVKIGVDTVVVPVEYAVPADDIQVCKHCTCVPVPAGRTDGYCSLACETDHAHVSEAVAWARVAA